MIVDGGAAIDVSQLIAPRMEGEVAFILGDAIEGEGVSADDVLAAPAGVAPALEVIDSRVADWRIRLPEHRGQRVIGRRRYRGARSPDGIDLAGLR